jgi:hypothetical protein
MGAWWTHAKFWFLAAAAIGVSVLVLVLRGLLQKKGQVEDPGFGGLPPAPIKLQQAADSAYEASIYVKATNRAETIETKKRLESIMKIDEPRKRRSALADFVNNK